MRRRNYAGTTKTTDNYPAALSGDKRAALEKLRKTTLDMLATCEPSIVEKWIDRAAT